MEDALAVVLGMGPTGLSIARCLGRRGVNVYGIGAIRSEVSFSSRYCRKVAAVDVRSNPRLLYEKLVGFARKNQTPKKVLYPSGDEYVSFMSSFGALLKGYFLFSDVSPTIVNTFLNKKEFYRTCLNVGIPAITSFFPESLEEAITIKDTIPYPCFIKPIYYHQYATSLGLRKGFLCKSRNEYVFTVLKLKHDMKNMLIQEVIEGPETDLRSLVTYIDRHGRQHGTFTARKIRQYPPDFGTGCAVLSSPEPEIVEPTKRLIERTKYNGMIDIEYKWCKESRIFKVIEANIRPCRFGALVEEAGVNPLFLSFLDLTGKIISHSPKQVYGIKWLFPERDIFAIVSGLIEKRFGLKEVLESYRKPRTWCIWASDDLKPFFAYFIEIIAKIVKTLFYRVSEQPGQLKKIVNNGESVKNGPPCCKQQDIRGRPSVLKKPRFTLPQATGNNQVHLSCQVCTEKALFPLYSICWKDFSQLMMRCSACGHVQAESCNPGLDDGEIDKDYYALFYDTTNSADLWPEIDAHWGRARSRIFQNIIKQLSSLGYSTGTMLDIGSGFGHFLDVARTKGFTVVGVDPSPLARELARHKLHIESFESLTCFEGTSAPFDVITCLETLFHSYDLRKMLLAIHKMLKPHGCLVIKVRANRTWLFRLASKYVLAKGHSLEVYPGQFLFGYTSYGAYHMFTTYSLHRLLESAGFRILKTVNEEYTKQKLTVRGIAKLVFVGLSKAVNVLTLGTKKIGTEITAYCTPVSVK